MNQILQSNNDSIQMQRQPPAKVLYVNSTLHKVNGDDTSFTCDLGNNYTFKRCIMTLFSMDNALSNFYGQWSSFALTVGGVTYSITCDVYLTSDTYLTWINDQLVALGANLVLTQIVRPTYSYRLSMQGMTALGANQPFTMRGSAWQKLGYTIDASASTHLALQCPDFSQSNVINIRLDNMPNSYSSGKGAFTFQVVNNASFQGRIIMQYPDIWSTQQLSLNAPVSLNQLSLTLLDCDLNKLTTIETSTNSNDIEVTMTIMLFEE